MSECIVYGLCSEPDGIRYIGQTIQPLKYRLEQHLRHANGKTRKEYWIRKCNKLGIDIFIIPITRDAEYNTDEIRLIAMYIANGYDLLNHTAGGMGVKNPDAQTKKKISDALTGKKRSEESKAKMSISQKCRMLKKSEREKTAIATAAAMARPEVRAKVIAGLNRANKDPAVKARRRDSAIARAAKPGARERMIRNRGHLTDSQVLQARAMYKAGIRIVDLCKIFGITQCPMSLLVSGKTYNHLPC